MKVSSKINKIILIALFILIAFCLCVFRGIGPFGSKSKNTCNSMEEVAEKVTEMLNRGDEGLLTVYAKNINEDELTLINFYLDSLKGNVTNIRTISQGSDVIKVELQVNRSDDSYVLDAIKYGNAIPANKEKAKELEEKVKYILANYIKSNMTDFDKELAIHDYIVNNCTYGFFNDGSEIEYSAYGALVKGKAVCSGYAAAMDLLLKCAGVDSRFVVGYAESSQRQFDDSNIKTEGVSKKDMEDNHAWNQVCIDGIWYNVDVTWDDPVGDGAMLSHVYMNIDDKMMSYTHDWNRKKYEKCESMSANYFRKTGTEFYSVAELESYCNYYFTKGEKLLECRINGFDVDNDNLQFMFGISGVNSVGYAIAGIGDYRILNLSAK